MLEKDYNISIAKEANKADLVTIEKALRELFGDAAPSVLTNLHTEFSEA